MSAIYSLSIRRRIELQLVARAKVLKLIIGKIAVSAERVLKGELSGERILIPVMVADRRRTAGHKPGD